MTTQPAPIDAPAQLPAARVPPDDAPALARDFAARRARPESLASCARQALGDCLGAAESARASKTPLGLALADIAAAADYHARRAPLPAYHGVAHFCEAVVAMAALCRREFGDLPGPERSRLCVLGLAIMAGHDLLHDGTRDEPGKSLEENSFQACLPMLRNRAVAPADIEALRQAILGTEDRLVPGNRQAYLDAQSAADGPDPIVRLRSLANEADLCASLLPGSGPLMGSLLAREWTEAGFPQGSTVGTWSSRAGFLEFAKPVSSASHALGLERARSAQLDAFDSLARGWGLSCPKEAGAQLDSITASKGPEAARGIYAQSLADSHPSVSLAFFGPQAA